MVCEHLAALEAELAARDVTETYRGQPWTANCREWVYFDIVFETDSVARRLELGPTVVVHENNDKRSGLERGFVCEACKDGIIGQLKGADLYK